MPPKNSLSAQFSSQFVCLVHAETQHHVLNALHKDVPCGRSVHDFLVSLSEQFCSLLVTSALSWKSCLTCTALFQTLETITQDSDIGQLKWFVPFTRGKVIPRHNLLSISVAYELCFFWLPFPHWLKIAFSSFWAKQAQKNREDYHFLNHLIYNQPKFPWIRWCESFGHSPIDIMLFDTQILFFTRYTCICVCVEKHFVKYLAFSFCFALHDL